ncbi:MAG: protein-glutamate O-methyltransferase CheR [Desulfobulbaceae bacterium]|nr:protein-glutamate O-methyltransferase CheR [Desulfobulbaceae bacterium]
MIKITETELKSISQLIHEKSGIVIDDGKAYLLESRLAPLLTELNLNSFSDLYSKLRVSNSLTNQVIDEISNHETSFFRDHRPFVLLKNRLLPDLENKFSRSGQGNFSIRIWSAACSTGQEVYSIAIVVREFFGRRAEQYRVMITGTDIADSAIVKSSRGEYSGLEIGRGLSSKMVDMYFINQGKMFRVKDELRALAFFQKLNLLKPFDSLGKFDIIFCRNVAIYFSLQNRRRLFDRIADQLNPGGILILGGTELLFGITDRFRRCEEHDTFYYQLKTGSYE